MKHQLSIGELSEVQSYEQNRLLFIQRLVNAGWKQHEAEQEWETIQEDEESGL